MQKQPNSVIRISMTEVIKWPSPGCPEVAFRLVNEEFGSRQEALDYVRSVEFIPNIEAAKEG